MSNSKADSVWEDTKANVASASDDVTSSVQAGLKSMSENIGAAADSLEKKAPTAWEQTKTGVSDAVDSVTTGVQEGWDSLTAEKK